MLLLGCSEGVRRQSEATRDGGDGRDVSPDSGGADTTEDPRDQNTGQADAGLADVAGSDTVSTDVVVADAESDASAADVASDVSDDSPFIADAEPADARVPGPVIGEPANCADPEAVISPYTSNCVLPHPVDCGIPGACPSDYACTDMIGYSYCVCIEDSCGGPYCPGEGFGELPCPDSRPLCGPRGVCEPRLDCKTSAECAADHVCVGGYDRQRTEALTDSDREYINEYGSTCRPVAEIPYDRSYNLTPTCRRHSECGADEFCRLEFRFQWHDEPHCVAYDETTDWIRGCHPDSIDTGGACLGLGYTDAVNPDPTRLGYCRTAAADCVDLDGVACDPEFRICTMPWFALEDG
jgi:hypothetical protein